MGLCQCLRPLFLSLHLHQPLLHLSAVSLCKLTDGSGIALHLQGILGSQNPWSICNIPQPMFTMQHTGSTVHHRCELRAVSEQPCSDA